MIKRLDMEDADTVTEVMENKQLRHLGLSLLRFVTAAKYFWDSSSGGRFSYLSGFYFPTERGRSALRSPHFLFSPNKETDSRIS